MRAGATATEPRQREFKVFAIGYLLMPMLPSKGPSKEGLIGADILFSDANDGTALFRIGPPAAYVTREPARSWGDSHVDCWLDGHSFLAWTESSSLDQGPFHSAPGLDLTKISFEVSPPACQIVCPRASSKLSAFYGTFLQISTSGAACPAVAVSRHGGRVLLQVPNGMSDSNANFVNRLCVLSPHKDSYDTTLSHLSQLTRANVVPCWSPCGRFFGVC